MSRRRRDQSNGRGPKLFRACAGLPDKNQAMKANGIRFAEQCFAAVAGWVLAGRQSVPETTAAGPGARVVSGQGSARCSAQATSLPLAQGSPRTPPTRLPWQIGCPSVDQRRADQESIHHVGGCRRRARRGNNRQTIRDAALIVVTLNRCHHSVDARGGGTIGGAIIGNVHRQSRRLSGHADTLGGRRSSGSNRSRR